MPEARAGLEVGDMAFYPVRKIGREQSGWVKVVVWPEDVYYNGTFLDLAQRLSSQPGRLVTATPRQNLLQEDLGVLKRLIASQDIENPVVEFWFQKEEKGRVIAV